jgi:YD repeat-containing protein
MFPRPLAVLLSATLTPSPALPIPYTYDAGSRLTSAADADATLTYTYDALNQVLSFVTRHSSLVTPFTVSYTYDKAGNRLSLSMDYGLSTIDYGLFSVGCCALCGVNGVLQ